MYPANLNGAIQASTGTVELNLVSDSVSSGWWQLALNETSERWCYITSVPTCFSLALSFFFKANFSQIFSFL